MPPKKRLRGPKLSPVREDESVEVKKAATKKKTVEEILEEDAELLIDDDVQEQPDEENVQPVSASEVAVVRKKNLEKALRDSITSSIRQTFQSRQNILDAIKQSSHQLLNAYGRAAKPNSKVSKDVFFSELDIRLCFMIEAVTVMENRARVMKSVCEAACNLIHESGDTSILDFLVGFFAQWMKSGEIDPRTNIASFIGYLFESGVAKRESEDHYAIFDMSYTRKLYQYLTHLMHDKSAVRVAAIRAISVLQNCAIPNTFTEALACTPKEELIKSFRDVAWECRLAAIEVFDPTKEMSQDIVDLALFDKSPKVRCVALKKFGDLLFRHTEDKMKVQVLYTCLNDHDVTIRDAVKRHVIETWLNRLARTYAKKINDDDVDQEEICVLDATGNPLEKRDAKKILGYGYAAFLIIYYLDVTSVESKHQVRFIMMHVLDTVRQMYNVHREPINLFAMQLVDDSNVDENIVNDLQYVHRYTISDFAHAQINVHARCTLVFFWRVMIEYIVDRATSPNDALLAVERMAPKMVSMCGVVRDVIDLFKTMEETGIDGGLPITDWEMVHICESNILQDLMISFRHFDKETSGKAAWKRLLEDMLYNINNTKALIDIIVQDLATYFYNDNPTGLLSDVAASISDMLNRITTGDQTMRDETVFIGTSKPKQVTQQDREVLMAITDYELLVLNSSLKTGIFDHMEVILKAKYESLVVPKLTSAVMDERIVAMECVGLIGMIDLQTVEKQLVLCRQIADKDVMAVKTTYFDTLADLCVTHGIDAIEQILFATSAGATQRGGKRKNTSGASASSSSSSSITNNVVASMCDVVLTEEQEIKNSDAVLKCCEGLGKLLLHETIEPDNKKWQLAIRTLLSRANYKLDGKFATKVRSIIMMMLKFFASLSVNNQQCLVNCFKDFFNEWDHDRTLIENAGAHEHIYHRLCRVATVFTVLTRHSSLIRESKDQTPCHVNLLQDAFRELQTNQESSASNFYCEVMQSIELECFTPHQISSIFEDVNELIADYEDDDPKNRIGELKKLRKRVMKIMGISDKPTEQAATSGEAVEEAMEVDEPSGVKEMEVVTTPQAPAPVVRRRTTKASTSKSTTDVDQELRALMDSPPRETVTKKPQKPASASRPRRTAARKL